MEITLNYVSEHDTEYYNYDVYYKVLDKHLKENFEKIKKYLNNLEVSYFDQYQLTLKGLVFKKTIFKNFFVSAKPITHHEKIALKKEFLKYFE